MVTRAHFTNRSKRQPTAWRRFVACRRLKMERLVSSAIDWAYAPICKRIKA